ncbi:MAG: CDP-glucose 4,6-dehydratase [Desulfovibrionaceae bacterium]
MFTAIYKNKKVFLTGHTGFKGSWLALWLTMLHADVMGYSLAPDTEPSLHRALGQNGIYGNILDTEKLENSMSHFQPDIVFHLAAQPLVRMSYYEPVLTYQTNVLGTLNVLEAARKIPSVKAFVNITTDKCYENKEFVYGYKEDDPMGGYDMYSSSKACVEIMSSSYRQSFLQNGLPYAMATARAGNVIGGGDWAKDRLLPDCVRALNNNTTIEIRKPEAIRPWQHVLEPLSGYLLLGKKLLEDPQEYANAFNFGPNEDSVCTVLEVIQKFAHYWGKTENIVYKKDTVHEASLLMLNIDRAKEILGWFPTYNLDEALRKTAEWYKCFYARTTMLTFTQRQIEDFMKDAQWNKN